MKLPKEVLLYAILIHGLFICVDVVVCADIDQLHAGSSYQMQHTQILRDLIKSAHDSYKIICINSMSLLQSLKALTVFCSSCHDLRVNAFVRFFEVSLKDQLCLTGVNKPYTEK